jgi:hypothetical protein
MGRVPSPVVQVDWSWDQDNNRTWDYRVGLSGKHSIGSIISLNELSVQTVPYPDLPKWVLDREWDVAVFAAAEDGGRWGSEGYQHVWTANLGRKQRELCRTLLGFGYGTGVFDAPPIDAYEEGLEGTREEVSFQFMRRPLLYYSPIDWRLHLVAAHHGIGQIDDFRTIRYDNQDEDDFIDSWSLFDNGVLVGGLFSTGQYVIHFDRQAVAVFRNDLGDSLFKVVPPQDNHEWTALLSRISDKPQMHISNISAMASQFEPALFSVDGADLRDFRLTDDGFRFTLNLRSGYRIISDAEGLGRFLERPGPYLFNYDDGGFWVTIPSSPVLHAVDFRISTQDGFAHEQDWNLIETTIENGGLDDARDLQLCATLTGPGRQRDVLTATVALVTGQGSQHVSWSWLPQAAGMWDASLAVGCDTRAEDRLVGQVLATARIEVRPPAAPPLGWLLSLSGAGGGILVLLSAIGLLAAGAVALWLYWQGLWTGGAGEPDGVAAGPRAPRVGRHGST